MQYLHNIDLSKNELQNARIQNLAAAPGSPAIGQLYWHTVDDTAYVWDGTIWLNIGVQASGAAEILVNVATSTIIGRTTAGSGDSEELTAAQVRTILGIEAGATADQTAGQIKTAYESNADTNEFSDAEQTTVGNQSGTNTGDELSASVTVSGVVELATIAEVDTGTDATRAVTPDSLEGSALQTKVDGIETGATTDQTNAEIRAAVEAATDSNAFTDADNTKLDGIEALANVTDATNVNAAGATMNSDTSLTGNGYFVDDDAMTANSASKAISQQSAVAYIAAEIAAAITSGMDYKGAYNASTNSPDLDTSPIAADIGDVYAVTVAGTFFTVAVEAGDLLIANQGTPTLVGHWDIVQANLTAASIKTAYESNADTNEFSDAEQTTVGNQSGTNTGDEPAASATVPGIIELATIAEVNTGTSTTRAVTPDSLEGSALQIKVDGIETGATTDQTSTQIAAAVEAASNSNTFNDADHSKLNAIETSATADQTNAEIRTAVEAATDSNAFTDADHSKLNAIEASATADQTDAQIRTAVEAATDSNVFTDADHTKLNASPEKYSVLVGNGSLTSITVTHSLNTRDVQVELYDAATYETVLCDVVRTTTAAVTLGFAVAPTTNKYKVVVIG